MTRRSAFSSGSVVYQGDDKHPAMIPPGECEVEQSPADNSYIVRWEEQGAPHTARFSALEYFDLIRTKRLRLSGKGGSLPRG